MKMEEKMKKREEEVAINVWDCGSPLYDSYEVASFGQIIERHMMKLPFSSPSFGSKRFKLFSSSFSRDENKNGLAIKKKENKIQEKGIFSKMMGYFLKRKKVKHRNGMLDKKHF
ncbi:hypothetical protein M5689_008284 [Euphorbia peplus]|nr:hypothetical protein M5689_008284 [Euphorbia peplus]